MVGQLHRMGLTKSKNPGNRHSDGSDDSTDDSSLRSRRRRRLSPTPSQWTSGESVDSCHEVNQAGSVAARKRENWSDSVEPRSSDQKRSMLKKLVGRLSQKIKPQDTSRSSTDAQPNGRRNHDVSFTSFSSAGVVVVSAHPVHVGRPVHCHPHTSLSIRSSLQSCSETALVSDFTNNNCQRPVQTVHHNSNQVCTCFYASSPRQGVHFCPVANFVLTRSNPRTRADRHHWHV